LRAQGRADGECRISRSADTGLLLAWTWAPSLDFRRSFLVVQSPPTPSTSLHSVPVSLSTVFRVSGVCESSDPRASRLQRTGLSHQGTHRSRSLIHSLVNKYAKHQGATPSCVCRAYFQQIQCPNQDRIRPLKNAICVVGLHPSSARRTGCTPHSSGFAHPASHGFSTACPQYGLLTACYGG